MTETAMQCYQKTEAGLKTCGCHDILILSDELSPAEVSAHVIGG